MQRGRVIIAHHLVLHGYGQWLPNDPRGSGLRVLRKEALAELGDVHLGRKAVQPPRAEMRAFYREAARRLDSDAVWFDGAKRQAVGESLARVVASQRYTVWGCAVLRNHAHLCVRRHRDDAVAMWQAFAESSRSALRGFDDVADDHPIWSSRPYKVFLYTPDDVRRVVSYIAGNPLKERLGAQAWPFVKSYDGWPHAAKRSS